jgi:hypothetical protein
MAQAKARNIRGHDKETTNALRAKVWMKAATDFLLARSEINNLISL